MSKFKKMFNEFFYAWGDNDPEKVVLRYGKFLSLKQWNLYDDYKYYKPRRDMAGGLIILGGLSLIGLSVKGIKVKYDKRKADKEKD